MSDLKSQVFEKAELAVQQMSSGSPVPLDYTRDSLAGVESLLAEASEYIDELPRQQVSAIRELLGSYILRVGYAEFGGEVLWHDEREQPVLVVGEPEFHIAIMTFDKVEGRLNGDEGDNIPFFYEGFATRAAKAESNDQAIFL